MKVYVVSSGTSNRGESVNAVTATLREAELQCDRALDHQIDCYGGTREGLYVRRDFPGCVLYVSVGGSFAQVKEFELMGWPL